MPGVAQPGIVGAREDLSGLIFTYDEGNHPIFRMIKKTGKVKSEVHQHQADKRASANKRGFKDNAPSPTAASKSSDRKLIESLPHWFRDSVSAGYKAENINEVAGIGRGKLYANEVKKAMDAQKDAIEQVISDNTDSRDEGVNGSETRGLFKWIQTTAQSNRPVPEAYRPPSGLIYSGTKADFDEDQIRSMGSELAAMRNSKGRAIISCGIDMKTHISDFSRYTPNVSGSLQTRQVNSAQKDRLLQAIVDVIECDGAHFEVHFSNHLFRDRDADTNAAPTSTGRWALLMLDPDAWELKMNQAFEHVMLPGDGGGKRGEIQSIVTLCGTPRSSGKANPSDA